MPGICNGHDPLVLVTHRYPRKYWLPANSAIEAAYPDKKRTFFGSQYAQGRGYGTLLPKGFGGYNADELAKRNQFLDQFRGIEQQLRPDIIDFGNSVFYEIKTYKFRDDGLKQLMGYHKLAAELTAEIGIPPFSPDLATWYPPATLLLPGNPGKIVCTELTNHNKTPSGLLLYSIWKPSDDEDEDESDLGEVMVTAVSPTLTHELRRMIAKGLHDRRNFQAEGEYEILAPRVFMEGLAASLQMERTMRALTLPTQALRDSVYMGHIASAAIGSVSTVAALSVLIGVATGGESLVVEADAAAAAADATLTTAAVAAAADDLGASVSVNAISALARAANDNAIPIAAKAAGFVVLTFFVSKTAAASENLAVTGVDGIILARSEDVDPVAPYGHNRPVQFRGRNYLTVGHARGI
jgi:hypothetical protein